MNAVLADRMTGARGLTDGGDPGVEVVRRGANVDFGEVLRLGELERRVVPGV